MSPAPRALALSNVSKRFGAQVALDDVTLSLRAGERLALVGENGAGKSSLMNVLYGLYQPDSGHVSVDGRPTRLSSPADAMVLGVGMVHQHFTLVGPLTVAENVVLGREPTRWGRLDAARALTDVQQTCARLGFSLDPSATVESLSVGAQQKVEIVKALHRGVSTLVLDEPTAVLTPREALELFEVTRRLSDEGLTVVLISHKLREVLSFATRVAVMRRGRLVAETTPANTSAEALAALMVGERNTPSPPPPRLRGPPLLTLDRVGAGALQELSLTVHEGELVGIAGVDGNGQRELAQLVTGLRPLETGQLSFLGAAMTLTPASARAAGIAHVPEDRLRHAMVGDFTVAENVSLGRQRAAPFARGPRIDFEGRRARSLELVTAHDVRPPDVDARLGSLSGGNQQKLVVARELDSRPRLLVAAQPTRGLDLGAVDAVRARLLEFCANGGAVLLLSLDLDEVLAVCDRVVVLYGGRVSGRFERADFDEQRIGACMMGVVQERAS